MLSCSTTGEPVSGGSPRGTQRLCPKATEVPLHYSCVKYMIRTTWVLSLFDMPIKRAGRQRPFNIAIGLKVKHLSTPFVIGYWTQYRADMISDNQLVTVCIYVRSIIILCGLKNISLIDISIFHNYVGFLKKQKIIWLYKLAIVFTEFSISIASLNTF